MNFVRGSIGVVNCTLAITLLALPSNAAHTPPPTSVAIAGSFQSELGCPGDWDPGCAATELAFDADDEVWQASYNIPAGNWEYKAAINDSWDENYGANAVANGPNIALTLAAATNVKFYYDAMTHWVTDNVNSAIATVAGSFQSELGCPGDWDPGCLRSWMQDPDGDGVYTFVTDALPVGTYEFKVARDEQWNESYPATNQMFSTDGGEIVIFTYDPRTNEVSVTVEAAPTPTPSGDATPTPTTVIIENGGTCETSTDCASGYCVDDTCCDVASCSAGQSCNNPGNAGRCSPDPTSPAPAVSPNTLLLAAIVLAAIGAFAILRRRSST